MTGPQLGSAVIRPCGVIAERAVGRPQLSGRMQRIGVSLLGPSLSPSVLLPRAHTGEHPDASPTQRTCSSNSRELLMAYQNVHCMPQNITMTDRCAGEVETR